MDTESLPIPSVEEIVAILQAGEKVSFLFCGRVDGVEKDSVHVTLRHMDGKYSRAELVKSLFLQEPHKDMRFYLIVLGQQPSATCRVHILPGKEVKLTQAEMEQLRGTAFVHSVVSEYLRTTPIRPMDISRKR